MITIGHCLDALVPYQVHVNAQVCDNIIEIFHDTVTIQRGKGKQLYC